MKKTLFYKGIASLACLAMVTCDSALCQTFDSATLIRNRLLM
jgi:hypothetical protein